MKKPYNSWFHQWVAENDNDVRDSQMHIFIGGWECAEAYHAEMDKSAGLNTKLGRIATADLISEVHNGKKNPAKLVYSKADAEALCEMAVAGYKKTQELTFPNKPILPPSTLRAPVHAGQIEKSTGWVEQLAEQYGRRQMAALRNDNMVYDAATTFMSIIAREHWGDIVAALRKVS